MPPATAAQSDDFDPRHRFVHVTGINARGFVEFELCVGSRELCVELMLPADAFEEFCRAQRLPRTDALDAPARH